MSMNVDLRTTYMALVGCLGGSVISAAGAELEWPSGEPKATITLERGDLSVLFRANSQSPRVPSSVDLLFHLRAAPDFNAFDPKDSGASAGLNFEHVISGHSNRFNAFTPRRGRDELHQLPDASSVMLARRAVVRGVHISQFSLRRNPRSNFGGF